MGETVERAVAIVGVGAVMPDAADAKTFWQNIRDGRYSISHTPADRWNADAYYDSDPKAPDKTYSTLGGWVRDLEWDPLGWRLPIPPKVSDAMDRTQIYSIVAARQALLDSGYPDNGVDADRTAVILGNAMSGDLHYLTSLRIFFPEYAAELEHAPSFTALPADVQAAILDEFRAGVGRRIPDITEDTMPGELANITAGRIANLFNFHGPNFVTDAACASALAAIDAAIEGLESGDFDAVLTGGVDSNMSPSSFVKFCKIGALSATGTRPYADGADGFIMGEGAAVFLLKRLEDAERNSEPPPDHLLQSGKEIETGAVHPADVLHQGVERIATPNRLLGSRLDCRCRRAGFRGSSGALSPFQHLRPGVSHTRPPDAAALLSRTASEPLSRSVFPLRLCN